MSIDYQPLNTKIDAVAKANSTLNPLNIKPGYLSIGDKGIEFQSSRGPGFIQIPWEHLAQVRVQIFFGGRYVRGFFLRTDDDREFEFIVSDAKYILKAMRQYLPREKFSVVEGNLSKLFGRKE